MNIPFLFFVISMGSMGLLKLPLPRYLLYPALNVSFFNFVKKLLDRFLFSCYNAPRGDEKHPLIYGPLAQLVRASGS